MIQISLILVNGYGVYCHNSRFTIFNIDITKQLLSRGIYKIRNLLKVNMMIMGL